MLTYLSTAWFCLLLLLRSCSDFASEPVHLTHRAAGASPEVLAVYEAWFGHPKHIPVGYSSQDPVHLRDQIRLAKAMGISGFVVDWYGDREPFIDKAYALMQTTAAKEHFQVAMMYDETDEDEGATDEAIADLTMFHEVYLSSQSTGKEAYLTYEGRPVIFIFPKGKHTDWSKVRAAVDRWKPAPILINENLPGADANAFDGYYAWINPGEKGWDANGNNWGYEYLAHFYGTMKTKYPDKIIVGGAWPGFNDSKASWGLNRRISTRCGQTYSDTFNFWRQAFPSDQAIPFILVETWNDYEEGSAIEPGLPSCGPGGQTDQPVSSAAITPARQN
jgi:hypothetical protein